MAISIPKAPIITGMGGGPGKRTGPATGATPGHGLIGVSYVQDNFIIEAARLLATVGPANVGSKSEKDKLRSRIQGLLSDYMETVLNKSTTKTSTGAAPDLIMSEADTVRTFGVTNTIKQAMRKLEIKSYQKGATGVTITQVGMGTRAGEKRRYETTQFPYQGSTQVPLKTGQAELGEFELEDQQKLDEINEFFQQRQVGVSGRWRGIEPESMYEPAAGKELRAATTGSRSKSVRPTGIFLIPWKPDGTIDLQNISGKSIGNFVKHGTGRFADATRQQILQKMNEGISFTLNFDKLKKKTAAPVTYVPKGALTLDDYNYEMEVESNKVKNGYTTVMAIRPKLNENGKAKYKAITMRLDKSPQAIMKGFIDYADKRLRSQYSGTTDRAKKAMLLNFIGFFAQFSVGTLTPYVVIGELKTAKNIAIRGKGSLINKTKVIRQKKAKQTRGQFISNAQLSVILQKRLAQTMPRYSEPNRPTPRYITGKLAQSFQIMANYRTGLMGYLNTPPVSGYVDLLNQGGWQLDKTLVEPTIRQITQQLFGRQFKVLRTQ